jgi:hypothetical protein
LPAGRRIGSRAFGEPSDRTSPPTIVAPPPSPASDGSRAGRMQGRTRPSRRSSAASYAGPSTPIVTFSPRFASPRPTTGNPVPVPAFTTTASIEVIRLRRIDRQGAAVLSGRFVPVARSRSLRPTPPAGRHRHCER